MKITVYTNTGNTYVFHNMEDFEFTTTGFKFRYLGKSTSKYSQAVFNNTSTSGYSIQEESSEDEGIKPLAVDLSQLSTGQSQVDPDLKSIPVPKLPIPEFNYEKELEDLGLCSCEDCKEGYSGAVIDLGGVKYLDKDKVAEIALGAKREKIEELKSDLKSSPAGALIIEILELFDYDDEEEGTPDERS